MAKEKVEEDSLPIEEMDKKIQEFNSEEMLMKTVKLKQELD